MGRKSLPSILKSKDISSLVGKSPDDINYLARKGIIKGYKKGNNGDLGEKRLNPGSKRC